MSGTEQLRTHASSCICAVGKQRQAAACAVSNRCRLPHPAAAPPIALLIRVALAPLRLPDGCGQEAGGPTGETETVGEQA